MSSSLIQIIVLGIVQGITEFLPISSSGHLVIVHAILAQTGGAMQFDVSDVVIVLHAGTLLSILVFYWQCVWRLVGEDRRVLSLLVVGTLPAAVVGLTVKLAFKGIFESPLLAGFMLMATGAMLLWIARRPFGSGAYQRLTYGQSLLIGLSQAVAILPGISRSGSTISAGLSMGMSPKSAATFSFLLAISVIAGAAVLEIKDLALGAPGTTPLTHLAVGAAVSFAVGLVALRWLISWLERGRLQYFGYWCLAVGPAVAVWQLAG